MSQRRRLERIESAFDQDTLILRLEDGSPARLERAANIRLMMLMIEVHAAAYEAGEAPGEVVLEHPDVEVFARSVPMSGEGSITQFCREACQRMLEIG